MEIASEYGDFTLVKYGEESGVICLVWKYLYFYANCTENSSTKIHIDGLKMN